MISKTIQPRHEIRRQDIEILRILSAFGIVFFHANGSNVAYAALIIFAILSMFLSGTEKKKVTVELVSKRFKRLIIPWVVWFVIYGLINLVRQKEFFPVGSGVVSGILAGSSIHLWYMPFIFGCILLFDVIKNNFSRIFISIASPLLAAIILFFTPIWREASIELGAPLAQYAHAMAAIFIGISFSYIGSQNKYISTFLLFLIISSAIIALPFSGVGLTYLIAILCSLLLITKLGERCQKIDFYPLSQCMLGVYFIHIAIMRLVGKFFLGQGILIPIVTFITSTIFVFFARKLFPKLACYWL